MFLYRVRVNYIPKIYCEFLLLSIKQCHIKLRSQSQSCTNGSCSLKITVLYCLIVNFIENCTAIAHSAKGLELATSKLWANCLIEGKELVNFTTMLNNIPARRMTR